jgi:hypothetical protein
MFYSVHPLARVHILCGPIEASEPFRLAVEEEATVDVPILKQLESSTKTQIVLPLSFKDGEGLGELH